MRISNARSVTRTPHFQAPTPHARHTCHTSPFEQPVATHHLNSRQQSEPAPVQPLIFPNLSCRAAASPRVPRPTAATAAALAGKDRQERALLTATWSGARNCLRRARGTPKTWRSKAPQSRQTRSPQTSTGILENTVDPHPSLQWLHCTNGVLHHSRAQAKPQQEHVLIVGSKAACCREAASHPRPPPHSSVLCSIAVLRASWCLRCAVGCRSRFCARWNHQPRVSNRKLRELFVDWPRRRRSTRSGRDFVLFAAMSGLSERLSAVSQKARWSGQAYTSTKPPQASNRAALPADEIENRAD